ncbi:DUF4832 domain-containing protein [Nonomuraea gerenzanensis]|uniref:DUF4832 domain-containing protein n=1 Tax=Nonomuraea gerenzanensis TaxID=93944 RepID=A0A1M4E4B7_9ACTN|nr:DUF4832 domain-containing protein [Nonomuraea gerenzanensis]UBU15831.1 DUF4832 domain-containing protein [Nonomuraea gerenzanensis]SBO93620.1 hypothetical protein BN4615_P3134 [Nonomuraea gerenzanensis]
MRKLVRSLTLFAFLCASIIVAPSAALAAITGQSATNTATTVTYQFTYTGSPAYARVHLDTDRSAATGFAQGGVGADFLLENAVLYRHNGGGWSWTQVGPVTYSASGGTARWTVARSAIGESATPNDADLVFQVESPLETSAGYTHVYSGGAGGGSVTYTPTTADFANPERGLYHHTGDCDKNDFSLATLQSYRTSQHISLVMCVFYLAEFKTAAISQAALDQLQQQLDTVRAAGLKMVLRLAYTTSTDGADAAKDRVLAHLDQLKPYLTANQDVIYLMQAGFIGAWGEWYYTQNFGNAGTVTAADWANRKAVVDKLLGVLPSTRMVQLRTPKFKRTMYTTTPVTSGQAYGGSAVARLGHHNDCFLASPDDYGTYENAAVEYPYLEAETRYVAMGGETCNPNPPRSDCPTAEDELSRFHWSYLNTDYHTGVLASWSTGGCLAEITRSLGYRFALQSGTYPSTATRGGGLPVTITLRNDGYAAPVNPRGLELLLRNTSTGAVHRLPLSADPRRWAAGATSTITQTVTLPAAIPAGSYALLLNLPDPLLPARPEYAIRLANEGTWEPATGFNDLQHTVTVS